MISAIVLGAVVLISFFMGAFSLFGYMLWRMMRNDGWDKSNITNAVRVLSHVVLHTEDFGKMYYLTDIQKKIIMETMVYTDNAPVRPFWYVGEDEFEGVVKTRP